MSIISSKTSHINGVAINLYSNDHKIRKPNGNQVEGIRKDDDLNVFIEREEKISRTQKIWKRKIERENIRGRGEVSGRKLALKQRQAPGLVRLV